MLLTPDSALSPHGKRLRSALKAAHRSQNWISKQTGIAPNNISNWMNGHALPTEHNWWKVGKVLGKDRTQWAKDLAFADYGGGKSLLNTGPTPKGKRAQGTLHGKTQSFTHPTPPQPQPSESPDQETDDVFQMESGTMNEQASKLIQACQQGDITLKEAATLWQHLEVMRGRAPARRAESPGRR